MRALCRALTALLHCTAEPEFLFRARELSDLEEALSPSSKALLTSALPALPVLLLGLISLEAKDLVREAGWGARGSPGTTAEGVQSWQSAGVQPWVQLKACSSCTCGNSHLNASVTSQWLVSV